MDTEDVVEASQARAANSGRCLSASAGTAEDTGATDYPISSVESNVSYDTGLPLQNGSSEMGDALCASDEDETSHGALA